MTHFKMFIKHFIQESKASFLIASNALSNDLNPNWLFVYFVKMTIGELCCFNSPLSNLSRSNENILLKSFPSRAYQSKSLKS